MKKVKKPRIAKAEKKIAEIEFEKKKYKLRRPIKVTLTRDEKGFTVYAPTLNIIGAGRDYDEALEDFGADIVERYPELIDGLKKTTSKK